MTRQEQFKEEFFALLRKYKVEMEVEEETHNYATYASGIHFFSYTQWDEEGNIVGDCIDFKTGTWENGE